MGTSFLKMIGLILVAFSTQAFAENNIAEVQPTSLGLKRMNAYRQSLGKAPLSVTPRSFGDDTITVESLLPILKNTNPTLNSEISASLPESVDNALLPSFPPPLQQFFGDCHVMSPSYYTVTHNMGLALGYDNKTSTAHQCSPAFAGGLRQADGYCSVSGYSAFSHNLVYGCAPMSDVPYTLSFGQTCSVSWGPFSSDVMTRAQDLRLAGVERFRGSDRDMIKRLLVNGYAIAGITSTPNNLYVPIKANPIRGSNAWVGQPVITAFNAVHIMTLVGYDDNAWYDLNGDGIMTSDELGVWRLADSGFVNQEINGNYGSAAVPGFYHIPYSMLQDYYLHHAVPRSPTPRTCHLAPQIVSPPNNFDIYLYNPMGGPGVLVPVSVAIKNPNPAGCAPAAYQVQTLEANSIFPAGGGVTVAAGETGTAILYYSGQYGTPVPETPFTTQIWVQGPDQSSDLQPITYTYHAYPLTTSSPTPSPSPVPPAADTQAPVVTILSPSTGLTVSKAFTLSASGTDNVSVSNGIVLLDGKQISSFAGASVSLSINPKSWKRGSHTITVLMRDPSNNSGQSSVILKK